MYWNNNILIQHNMIESFACCETITHTQIVRKSITTFTKKTNPQNKS